MPDRRLAAWLTALSLAVSAAGAFAEERPGYDTADEYERGLSAAIADSKATPQTLFYLELVAGRELLADGHTESARTHFRKALDAPVAESKNEPFAALLGIADSESDRGAMRALVKDWQAYLAAHSELATPPFKAMLAYYDDKAAGRPFDPKTGKLAFSGQDVAQAEANLAELIGQGQFAKALAQLNPKAMAKTVPLSTKTTYDLLNVLVFRRGVKELYCEKSYRKYPNALSYSTMICGALIDYRESGKVDPERVKRLEKYLREDYPSLLYLAGAVRKL